MSIAFLAREVLTTSVLSPERKEQGYIESPNLLKINSKQPAIPEVFEEVLRDLGKQFKASLPPTQGVKVWSTGQEQLRQEFLDQGVLRANQSGHGFRTVGWPDPPRGPMAKLENWSSISERSNATSDRA